MPAKIDWNSALQLSIIEGIESGATLREVAENNGISASFIIKKVREDQEFCKQYARVMETRTDQDFAGLDDDLKETPQTVCTKFGEMVDAGWVAWKRLQIDTKKWSLSKRNPKKYGERVTHDGEIGIKTVVIPQAAKDAAARPERSPEFDED